MMTDYNVQIVLVALVCRSAPSAIEGLAMHAAVDEEPGKEFEPRDSPVELVQAVSAAEDDEAVIPGTPNSMNPPAPFRNFSPISFVISRNPRESGLFENHPKNLFNIFH